MGCPKLNITDYYRFTNESETAYRAKSDYRLKNAYRDFWDVFSFPGEDLSGTGELIAETNASGTFIAMSDGNKNIMAYVDASTGSVVANYEYSPFRVRVESGVSSPGSVHIEFR